MSTGGFGLARNLYATVDGSGGGGSVGGKVTFAKKTLLKKKEQKVAAVVDDWEAAELAEEAREGGESDGGAKLEDTGPVKEAKNAGEWDDDAKLEHTALFEEAMGDGETDAVAKGGANELVGESDESDEGQGKVESSSSTSVTETNGNDTVAEQPAPATEDEVPGSVIDGDTAAARTSMSTNTETSAEGDSAATMKLDWAGEAGEAANK